MKVAIIGAGGGGLAVAHDFSQQGHEVRLFDFKEFPENIKSIIQNKGIYIEGDIRGFVKIECMHAAYYEDTWTIRYDAE